MAFFYQITGATQREQSCSKTVADKYPDDSGMSFDEWSLELQKILPTATYVVDRFEKTPSLELWEEWGQKTIQEGTDYYLKLINWLSFECGVWDSVQLKRRLMKNIIIK